MKYNDKNTLISNDKHLNRVENRDPWNLTDREQRRLDKKNYKKFLTKFSGRIKKDWWECLSTSDQKSIYREYQNILRVSYRNRTQPEFKRWLTKLKEEYKPNVQLYRERMIDNVLD